MFLARKQLKEALDRLGTVERQLNALERERKQDLLEYDNLYEKVRSVLGRIAKREQRVSQGEAAPAAEVAPCPDPVTAHVLNFRKDKRHVLG